MNSFSGVTFGKMLHVDWFSCRKSSQNYTFLQILFITSERGDISQFMGVGILWIGLNPTDFGCWRLTLR